MTAICPSVCRVPEKSALYELFHNCGRAGMSTKLWLRLYTSFKELSLVRAGLVNTSWPIALLNESRMQYVYGDPAGASPVYSSGDFDDCERK